ncbi:MAG: hypothetical protein GX774_07440 [Armatimonadetes bacterium]|nr:hypothetical protein [Armatimonadota bacterium]
MNLPGPALAILDALEEATDPVKVWGGSPRVDLSWGEVEAELFAMFREDDPDIGSNPRFRIVAHIDLPAAYALQRATEEEDYLPEDALLAAFDLELLLAPRRQLWPREHLEALASRATDWPATPGCQIDYANDELPYRHTLAFEYILTKGEFAAEFGWFEAPLAERQPLQELFAFLARALAIAKSQGAPS